jgi:rod shape-determining protein MreC
MKMIYPPRDNKRRAQRRLMHMGILIVVAIIIILISIFTPQIFSPFVQVTGVPLISTRAAATESLGDWFDVLHSKRSLVIENRDLREQLLSLQASNLEKSLLQQENTELQKMLGRTEDKHKVVVGRIISKPGFSPYDTMIIDAGSEDKVVVGDRVVAQNSTIIGEITSVNSHSSRAILYSAPSQKIQVLIGDQALETTAEGKGAGNFEVKLPRNANVKEGDVVVLAAHPTFIFGSVTSINVSDTDSFEQVLFRSAIDVAETKYVTIEAIP